VRQLSEAGSTVTIVSTSDRKQRPIGWRQLADSDPRWFEVQALDLLARHPEHESMIFDVIEKVAYGQLPDEEDEVLAKRAHDVAQRLQAVFRPLKTLMIQAEEPIPDGALDAAVVHALTLVVVELNERVAALEAQLASR
jgi:hypothetical protein